MIRGRIDEDHADAAGGEIVARADEEVAAQALRLAAFVDMQHAVAAGEQQHDRPLVPAHFDAEAKLDAGPRLQLHDVGGRRRRASRRDGDRGGREK